MITVNINDAPAQLPRLFEQASKGEHVFFCENNVPVFELKALPKAGKKPERTLGGAPFPMDFPDDAFDPLPEEMWNVFKEDDSGKNGA